MKLFLKVFKSLFKIIVATALTILSFILDALILVENKLSDINMKLCPPPSVNNEEYMNKLIEEHKKETSRKGINVD